jgi:hypothetical protein
MEYSDHAKARMRLYDITDSPAAYVKEIANGIIAD